MAEKDLMKIRDRVTPALADYLKMRAALAEECWLNVYGWKKKLS